MAVKVNPEPRVLWAGQGVAGWVEVVGLLFGFSEMISIPPISVIVRQARHKLLGSAALHKAAVATEMLWPSEVSEQPEAIYLEDDLAKITGTFHGNSSSDIAREIQTVTAPEATHAPCLAHHLKDVIIYGGSAYGRDYKHYVSRSRDRGHDVHLQQAALVSTNFGSTFFGHWLSDDCLQYELAKDAGHHPIQASQNTYAHQPYYAKWFNQSWGSHIHGAHIDDLIVYQDFSQSSYKQKRVERIRHRLAAQIQPRKSGGLVYLKRGNGGAVRRIENESAIEDRLSAKGFEIVTTATSDPTIMMTSLMGARLIVSMEGSHSVPAVFTLAGNGALLQLQPQDRFVGVQRGLIHGAKISRFGFVVGLKSERGYTFDVDDIVRISDALLN